MRILIAPDKFKGSLGARDVAENIAAGLRDILPNAEIDIMPVADGGEGTAAVICEALHGSWIRCKAHDALGREIECRYARIENHKLAVMEMSEAAGMWRLAKSERDPVHANTFGVGEMLLHATQNGAKEIIIGLGGSATNDGGFGMARALGCRFLAENEQELRSAVTELQRLIRIVRPEGVAPLVPLQQIIAAADVRNPLLGEGGATRVFGPQKGATPEQVESLERALETLAEVVARDLNRDFRDVPGAGAAGGIGFGLLSFCGATIRPGFDVVAEQIKLEECIRKADVIVTGEGSLDRQTLEGKAPAGVAGLAHKHGKRVFAIVGQSGGDEEVGNLFEKVLSLTSDSVGESESIRCAPDLLRERAKELAKLL